MHGQPATQKQWGLTRGQVIGARGATQALVAPLDGGPSVLCDIADVGLGFPQLLLGDRVVYSAYADGLGGCVLGRLADPHRQAPESRRLAVGELVIEATSRIVLSTKRAQLSIAEDGRVQLLSDTFVSKARKIQRLLAPLLRLN